MSDTVLLGVLRMSFENAMSTLTARFNYHQRGVQAADEIEKRTRERNEALAEVERLRAENDELYRAAGRTRAALSGWILASPDDRKDEPTHELVAEVVAEAERLRFQRSLRKLRDKP